MIVSDRTILRISQPMTLLFPARLASHDELCEALADLAYPGRQDRPAQT